MSSQANNPRDDGVLGSVSHWIAKLGSSGDPNALAGDRRRFYEDVHNWLDCVRTEMNDLCKGSESVGCDVVAQENTAAAVARIATHTRELQARVQSSVPRSAMFRKAAVVAAEEDASPEPPAPARRPADQGESVAQFRARLRAERQQAAAQAAAERKQFVASIRESVRSIRRPASAAETRDSGEQGTSAEPTSEAVANPALPADPFESTDHEATIQEVAGQSGQIAAEAEQRMSPIEAIDPRKLAGTSIVLVDETEDGDDEPDGRADQSDAPVALTALEREPVEAQACDGVDDVAAVEPDNADDAEQEDAENEQSASFRFRRTDHGGVVEASPTMPTSLIAPPEALRWSVPRMDANANSEEPARRFRLRCSDAG